MPARSRSQQFESLAMIALKALPDRDIGTTGAERRVGGWGRCGPNSCARLGHRDIEVGRAALGALEIQIEKSRDEMRAVRVAPLLSPGRILEPVVVPEALTHRRRRRIQADRVAGALECQQVAIGIDSGIEEPARAACIV